MPDAVPQSDTRIDDDTPLCKACGYPLVKLTSSMCPECGQSFDLTNSATFTTRRSKQPSPLRNAVLFSFLSQVMGFFFFGSVLDGGEMATCTLIAAIAQWAFIAFILLRRRKAPTRFDLIWIHVGFFVLVGLVFVLAPFLAGWLRSD